MDTVELDGVTYVKASVAAKRFKYTADYIGQLCRGRKIDARLVGRTWFVNPISLEEHKQQRYQKTESSQVNAVSATDTTSNAKAERVSVPPPPPPKEKTPRAIYNSTGPSPRAEERTLRVSYELDEGHLIPNLIKREYPAPHSLRVSPADAKSVKIKGSRTESSFTPEELPDVALSGKVTITPIEEASESEGINELESKQKSDEKTLKNNIISDKESNHSKSAVLTKTKRVVKIRKPAKDHSLSTSTGTSVATTDSISSKKQSVSDSSRVITPSFSPISVRQQPKQRVSTFVAVSPLLATLVAAVVVLFIFSTSTTVIFNELGYQSQLTLQVANLLDILTR